MVMLLTDRKAETSRVVTTSFTAASLFIAMKSGPGRSSGRALCSNHFIVTVCVKSTHTLGSSDIKRERHKCNREEKGEGARGICRALTISCAFRVARLCHPERKVHWWFLGKYSRSHLNVMHVDVFSGEQCAKTRGTSALVRKQLVSPCRVARYPAARFLVETCA